MKLRELTLVLTYNDNVTHILQQKYGIQQFRKYIYLKLMVYFMACKSTFCFTYEINMFESLILIFVRDYNSGEYKLFVVSNIIITNTANFMLGDNHHKQNKT